MQFINKAKMSMLNDKDDSTLKEVVPMAVSYEAGKKSSLITQRQSGVTYWPTTGVNIRSDNNRTTIFRLSASDFLDSKTANLQFRLSVPDSKIRFEDLYTSLINSITFVIGGKFQCHRAPMQMVC